MPTMGDELRGWYERFWSSVGDGEDVLTAAEERLGVALPALLRVAYGTFGLRRSAMVHLWPLNELCFQGDVLVIGAEQQNTWYWGVHRRRIREDNPLMSVGHDVSWKDESISLLNFLRFHAAINRVYEPPCFGEDSNEGADELAAWPEVTFSSSAFGDYALRCKGGVVGDPQLVRLGAKTERELREAMATLEIDEEFVVLEV